MARQSGGDDAAAMYRGDAARRGFCPTEKAAHGFVPWAFETGGPIRAAAAVADQVVYITSLDGGLYAVDGLTGRPRWRFAVSGGVDSSPVVAGGVVYFGGDMHVLAVEAATGRQRWRYPTDALSGSSPAVAGGMVFIGASDSRLIAVDASSGTLRWEFATGGHRLFPDSPPQPRETASSAAVERGVVYFVGVDGNVYALTAKSGALRWTAPMQCDSRACVAVDGGIVYGASRGNVFALDASSGAVRWQQQVNTTFDYCVPAVADGRVFIAGRRAGSATGGLSILGDLYAFDAKTGHRVWHLPTDSWVEASPAVDGNRVYLATRGSSASKAALSALDASTGVLHWEKKINFRSRGTTLLPVDGIRSSPTVAGGVLYLGNPNGYLYAYRADTGEGAGPRSEPIGQAIAYRLFRRLFGYRRPEQS
ncbi:PQQ-binding-like beta-propeller repeat protein [Allorhizocola rhizosphaerae]|uniref:outer membrane protein assembly factor BamB family protein n=1 Tax=Allorhizocola rhizosphaerae TaxID=1872709 RepID=UPI0013C30B32|nr:PQQ-binding-like beta-propeller repeat protein [Allorhizocola rhizosphaerae]